MWSTTPPSQLFQSTHPVRGATFERSSQPPSTTTFQSTHPVRGATQYPKTVEGPPPISIHAPREGCDATTIAPGLQGLSISIHAPREGCDLSALGNVGGLLVFQSTHPVRGATVTQAVAKTKRAKFQSTHPVRGATVAHAQVHDGLVISIHAPREGCDQPSG